MLNVTRIKPHKHPQVSKPHDREEETQGREGSLSRRAVARIIVTNPHLTLLLTENATITICIASAQGGYYYLHVDSGHVVRPVDYEHLYLAEVNYGNELVVQGE